MLLRTVPVEPPVQYHVLHPGYAVVRGDKIWAIFSAIDYMGDETEVSRNIARAKAQAFVESQGYYQKEFSIVWVEVK